MAARPKLSELLLALDGLSWSDIKLMSPHLSRHDLLPTLRKIEEARTIEERPLHAFQEWLDRDCEASWSGVVSALRAIWKNVLAKKLEDEYCSSAKKPAAVPLSLSSPAPSTSRSSTVHDTLPATPHTLDSVETTATASSPSLSSPQRDGASTITRGSTASEGTSTASGSTYVMASRGCNQAVTEEAVQLQETFVTVLTHTKICLAKKEMANKDFLVEFKITLTTLPLSKKHQHLKFLSHEEHRIMLAADIHEIFEILKPYWNYVDYSFLEYLVKEFGPSGLKREMKKYISQLEVFERKTSIKQFNSALLNKRDIPDHFSEIIVIKSKDPEQCSLYEVRQFKNEVVNQSSLHDYAMYLSKVSCSSVRITLAFPPEVAQEVWESLNRLSWLLATREEKAHYQSDTDLELLSQIEGQETEVPLVMAEQEVVFKPQPTPKMTSSLQPSSASKRYFPHRHGFFDVDLMPTSEPVPSSASVPGNRLLHRPQPTTMMTLQSNNRLQKYARQELVSLQSMSHRCQTAQTQLTTFEALQPTQGARIQEEIYTTIWTHSEEMMQVDKPLEQWTKGFPQRSERAARMVARQPPQPDKDKSETEEDKDKPETKPDQEEEEDNQKTQEEWENVE